MAPGETNMAVPTMPTVRERNADRCARRHQRYEHQDECEEPEKRLHERRSTSLLVCGRVRGFRSRLRPDPDKPHTAGQEELQSSDRANPVEVFELERDNREAELIGLEHVDRLGRARTRTAPLRRIRPAPIRRCSASGAMPTEPADRTGPHARGGRFRAPARAQGKR